MDTGLWNGPAAELREGAASLSLASLCEQVQSSPAHQEPPRASDSGTPRVKGPELRGPTFSAFNKVSDHGTDAMLAQMGRAAGWLEEKELQQVGLPTLPGHLRSPSRIRGDIRRRRQAPGQL